MNSRQLFVTIETSITQEDYITTGPSDRSYFTVSFFAGFRDIERANILTAKVNFWKGMVI
jgi:hypothetical protein